MTNLTRASKQWATRPADERFLSLTEMQDKMDYYRSHSRSAVVSSRALLVQPDPESSTDGLLLTGPNGHAYAPTHWAFGQLAQLSEAPAGYLRTLPAPIAADCLNFGLRFKRGPEDIGALLYKDGEHLVRAVTGPNYGRIWNADVVRCLTQHVGDGVSGHWRVPGIQGQALDQVTKENTTLYASDRDMFIFLADEERRVRIPNRRYMEAGDMARGFFVQNSEVGNATFSVSTFLFDFVCQNRIVWGAKQFKEIKIRHTASAPDKWVEQLEPALLEYANSSTQPILDTVMAAQNKRVDDIETFLAKRFGKRTGPAIAAVHMEEEGRPVETLWDITTAVTAYARQLPNQDARVALEREGGLIMDMAV